MNKIEKEQKKKRRNRVKWIKTLMICAIIILAGASSFMIYKAFTGACEAASIAYASTFQDTKNETSNAIYGAVSSYAENKYHVSNDAIITIDEVKETANLEVFRASTAVYNISDDNSRCTVYYGTGIFTVNLKEAEYVIDNERNYVLVRIPSPTLNTPVAIDDHKIIEPKYDGDIFETFVFNGSSQDGVEMGVSDRSAGQTKLEKEIRSTQIFYDYARTSAENMIQELVINFNPDVDDLTVDVEFTD